MPSTNVARRPLVLVAVGVGVLLLLTAGRYGYHRDELYFIEAGQHPAFGYVDQPPLVPLLAAAMDWLGGGSLTLFRVPSAIASGVTVMAAGLIAHELGASRRAQVLAAACMGVASITYAVGHLVSTSTYDLMMWTLLSWLLVRAVRDDGPVWLMVGLAAGIGLQVKILLAFLLLGVAGGILAAGPRRVLRSPWMWGGAALAATVWAPHLIWQAVNDWPQLQVAHSIAGGGSGTSEPRWAFLPFQLLLVSPLLFPVWMAGWWQLMRSPALRPWRFFAVTYAALAVVFLVTAGKPYYLAGLYPVLLAAGAEPTLRWVARGRHRLRGAILGVALAGSLAASAFLFLPLVPVSRLADTPVTDVNYDAGETVGWPTFAAAVNSVVEASTRDGVRPVVLTENYGEAGAMLRFKPGLKVYSGQNSFWTWGPPPEGSDTVVAVGFRGQALRQWFADVRAEGTIDNGVGLDNDEQGNTVWVCTSPRKAWSALWPDIRRIG